MSDEKTPIQGAAHNFYSILGDHTEDVLDEACAETWRGGEDDWWEHAMPVNVAEDHREATFRLILAELASLCLERSLGRYQGREVELEGDQVNGQ